MDNAASSEGSGHVSSSWVDSVPAAASRRQSRRGTSSPGTAAPAADADGEVRQGRRSARISAARALQTGASSVSAACTASTPVTTPTSSRLSSTEHAPPSEEGLRGGGSPPSVGGSGGQQAEQSSSSSAQPDKTVTDGASATPEPSAPTQPERPDCGICLEPSLHPVKLPCGHVFCYLCVKGFVKQSGRCAYCRADVPEKYLNNPKLLEAAKRDLDEDMEEADGFQWMYQGKNGWWRYDRRTNEDIEAAFSDQQQSLQIQVAGELYTIDLVAMTQYNDQCHGRRRRIRRDDASSAAGQCKGVAGLRKKQRRN